MVIFHISVWLTFTPSFQSRFLQSQKLRGKYNKQASHCLKLLSSRGVPASIRQTCIIVLKDKTKHAGAAYFALRYATSALIARHLRPLSYPSFPPSSLLLLSQPSHLLTNHYPPPSLSPTLPTTRYNLAAFRLSSFRNGKQFTCPRRTVPVWRWREKAIVKTTVSHELHFGDKKTRNPLFSPFLSNPNSCTIKNILLQPHSHRSLDSFLSLLHLTPNLSLASFYSFILPSCI